MVSTIRAILVPFHGILYRYDIPRYIIWWPWRYWDRRAVINDRGYHTTLVHTPRPSTAHNAVL